jgi:hypothetical protein
MATTNLGRVRFNMRGDYNPSADPLYSLLDLVSNGGGSFAYINDTPSNEPTSSTSHWQQIASVGGQDILNAVTAEKNAAIAAKVLAEGYAAQLAAGTASPSGTYANLAALNAGAPTAPNTAKIYITIDDGKWCYHNGTAWVAGGVYEAAVSEVNYPLYGRGNINPAAIAQIRIYGAPTGVTFHVAVLCSRVYNNTNFDANAVRRITINDGSNALVFSKSTLNAEGNVFPVAPETITLTPATVSPYKTSHPGMTCVVTILWTKAPVSSALGTFAVGIQNQLLPECVTGDPLADGTTGQLLREKGDGTSEWFDLPDDLTTMGEALLKSHAEGQSASVFGSALGFNIQSLRVTNNSLAEVTDVPIYYGGKNLLNNVGSTATVNGITYTVNADKSVHVTGTRVGGSSVFTFGTVVLPAGAYTFAGSGFDTSYAYINYGGINYVGPTEQTYTLDSQKSSEAVLVVGTTEAVDFTVYPMVRLASIKNDLYETFGAFSSVMVASIAAGATVDIADLIEVKSPTFSAWSLDAELSVYLECVKSLNAVKSLGRWAGKKMLVLGDSITTDSYLGYPNWANIVSNNLGMALVNPSVHAVGYLCGPTSATPNANSLINLIDALHTTYPDADEFGLIVFFRGVNDWGQNVAFGTTGDAKDASFTGAVEYCLRKSLEYWPNARIAVLTPMQRKTGNIANGAGKTLKQYADLIKEKAEDMSFPVLDMYRKAGWYTQKTAFGSYITTDGTINTDSQFANDNCLYFESAPDGLHPNRRFTETRLAPFVEAFINSL